MIDDRADFIARSAFEDALQRIPAIAPPLDAVRAAIGRERARRTRRRVVTTFAGIGTFFIAGIVASTTGVVAHVEALLSPARDRTMLVVAPHEMHVMRFVDSVDDAERRVPFAVYKPPAEWRLAKIAVSDGRENPVTESLYRNARGDWMKVTQRPLDAHPGDRDADADLSDLLRSANVAFKTVGPMHMKMGASVPGTLRTQIVDRTRVTTASVPANSVPVPATLDIDTSAPIEDIHTNMQRLQHHMRNAIKLDSIDFHGHVKVQMTIDQYGRRGFMIVGKPLLHQPSLHQPSLHQATVPSHRAPVTTP